MKDVNGNRRRWSSRRVRRSAPAKPRRGGIAARSPRATIGRARAQATVRVWKKRLELQAHSGLGSVLDTLAAVALSSPSKSDAILARYGFHVVELPLQAHPDIPSGGIPAGPRSGPMSAIPKRLRTSGRDAGGNVMNRPRLWTSARRSPRSCGEAAGRGDDLRQYLGPPTRRPTIFERTREALQDASLEGADHRVVHVTLAANRGRVGEVVGCRADGLEHLLAA